MQMEKKNLVFSAVATIIFSLCAFSAAPAQTDFSGIWVLDKAKTPNLPTQLESYRMVVTQNEQQLIVETRLEGDFRPEERERGNSTSGGGGFPGRRGGGRHDGGSSVNGFSMGMMMPSATYSLDGTETTAEIDDRMQGTATLKAKWTKEGHVLELSVVRHVERGGRALTITSKERWELSEGGQGLSVQRSTQSPRGTTTVKLMFTMANDDRPKEDVQ